ncbi:MAG: extracellular solute-binding protein [Candidatus Muirbacterium halophilum]|nr:extracellular solute-binding protein [Candidatus Muirbacterium halophilum]MCK9475968.1 extracellular solute-binding protein [Candidatus Muirbacterium halophilum]
MKNLLKLMVLLIVISFVCGCGKTDNKKTAQNVSEAKDASQNIYGFAMRNTLWWTFPFFNTFDAEFIDENGKCVLNNNNGVKALQYKVNLYTKYGVEAGAWQAGAIGPDTGFLNEKYAMIIDGPWDVQRFKDAGLNFGVALIPEGPAGSSTNVGGTNMVVFRGAKNPYWAAKFLEFLASPDIQAYWCNKLEQIPVNLKAYKMVNTEEKPFLKVFMEQMKYAKPRPNILNYSDLEEIINPQMEAALKGQKTVEQALTDATVRIEEEILSAEKSLEIPDGIEENYSKEKSVTVKIWVTYNPTEMQVFKEIIEMFEKNNAPVRIMAEPIPWGGHQEKILTSLATGTIPDIARVDATFVYKLAHKNAIYNLSQFGLDTIAKDITPAALGSAQFKGKLWAIPDQVNGVALFYNQDMFAEHGIRNPPKNWEEFLEIAEKLTIKH